jgi:hypothetical protein
MDTVEQLDLLADLGPRHTGSAAHQALVDDVDARLTGLGLDVRRDSHTFTRWHTERTRMSIGGRDVPVASALPYSGTTGPDGVEAPLMLLDGLRRNWAAARGRIAVIEVDDVDFPEDVLIGRWRGGPRSPIGNPVLSATLLGPDLVAARKAGVLAVVAVWKGLPEEEAAGQYLPFTKPYADLPAVWVAGGAAHRVLSAAREGDLGHVVLDAVLTHGSRTDTLWAVSPGSGDGSGSESGSGTGSDETVLVVSHSDGTNAVEENGHIGLVALARDAVARPHRRTVVFVLTTGHLRIPAVSAHGQATATWLEAHRDLWAGGPGQAKCVAGLVIEHLGAREFVAQPGVGLRPTGRVEPELLYATSAPLRDLVEQEWSGADPARPGPLIHFGEGEPLYERGIPCVALVTAPRYLLAQVPGHDRDLVDVETLERQVEAFRRLRERLDTADGLGPVVRHSVLSRAVASVRLFWRLLRARGLDRWAEAGQGVPTGR